MRLGRWQSAPLRRLGKLVGGGTPADKTEYWGGEVPFVTPPDLRSVVGGVVRVTQRTLTAEGAAVGSAIVPTGSVLLSIRAPIGYVARTAGPMSLNQGCRAIVPFETTHAPYLTYALMAAGAELSSLGRGTTFTEISTSQLASLELPVPGPEDQRSIADYLDRETASIDKLIDKQQSLISTLLERRAAVVSHSVLSVTSRRVQLRRLVDVIDCAHLTAEFVDGDNAFPVASIRECQGATVDLSTCSHTTAEFFAHLRAGNRAPRSGDLLFIRNVSVGLVSVVTPELPEFALGQETVLLRRISDASPRFLRYALLATEARHAIESAMIGSTFRRINVSAIRSLPVPAPSLDEQRRVASYLDQQTASIDALIAETERFIELARERRAALITAAVTGQIDVREIA